MLHGVFFCVLILLGDSLSTANYHEDNFHSDWKLIAEVHFSCCSLLAQQLMAGYVYVCLPTCVFWWSMCYFTNHIFVKRYMSRKNISIPTAILIRDYNEGALS